MGAALAKTVFERWGHLGHAPFRVLVYMALTALDSDEVPRYYGGRDALASALGKSLVGLDLDKDEAERAAYRAVDRAIKSLTVAKVIRLACRPAPGRQAEYLLALSMEHTTVSVDRTDHGERGPSDAPERRESMERTTVSGSNAPRSVVRTDHGERGPKEEQEEQEYLTTNRNARTDVTARAGEPPDNPDSSHGGVVTLRVIPGQRAPTATSPPVAIQPALWPSAVPEETDVNRLSATRTAREAVTLARTRVRAATAARDARGAANAPPPAAPRVPGPTCPDCSTELDPNGTCYICRDGKAKIA